MVKIKVNKDKCIGCGLCVSLCADVFELVDDKSSIKEGADLEANEQGIDGAIESCPVAAIEKE